VSADATPLPRTAGQFTLLVTTLDERGVAEDGVDGRVQGLGAIENNGQNVVKLARRDQKKCKMNGRRWFQGADSSNLHTLTFRQGPRF